MDSPYKILLHLLYAGLFVFNDGFYNTLFLFIYELLFINTHSLQKTIFLPTYNYWPAWKLRFFWNTVISLNESTVYYAYDLIPSCHHRLIMKGMIPVVLRILKIIAPMIGKNSKKNINLPCLTAIFYLIVIM